MKNKELAIIVSQVQKNRDKHYERLFSATWETVYYLSLKMMGNESDAEDVSQEIFIKIHNNIGQLESPEAFNTWMNRIVMNTCNTALVKRSKAMQNIDNNVFNEFSNFIEEDNTEFLPAALADAKETRVIIEEMIQELPAKQKQAILMYYYEEMSATEIAQTLDCATTAVNKRIHNAKATLRLKVESLQEEQDIKLYSVTTVPVLTTILKACAKETCTGGIKAQLWGGVSGNISALAATAGTTATTMSSVATAATSSVIATKVITIVVAASVMIGGGVIGVNVLTNQSMSSDTKDIVNNGEQTPEISSDEEVFPTDDSSDDSIDDEVEDPSQTSDDITTGDPSSTDSTQSQASEQSSKSNTTNGSTGTTNSSNVVVTGVSISPGSLTLTKGSTTSFSASVSGKNNPSQSILWSVMGGTSGTSISSSGVLSVSRNETATTLSVIARSSSNTNISEKATITLKAALPSSMSGLVGGASDVGKTFVVDGYSWKVIKADASGNLLIITTNIVGTTKFDATTYGSYSGSSLDSVMKNFYNNYLSDLKALAQPVVTVSEPKRNPAATTGGLSYVNASGTKTAFALSVSEVNTCFSSTDTRKATGGLGWYWLRSLGNVASNAAMVNSDGSLLSSAVNDVNGGLRPALWINVK